MRSQVDIGKIATALGAERRGKISPGPGGGYFGAMNVFAQRGDTHMLRWEDLESRSPEEVIAAGREKKRKGVRDIVSIALLPLKQQRRKDLDEDFSKWFEDAMLCMSNKLHLVLALEALKGGHYYAAPGHLKFVHPRNEEEQNEFNTVQQDIHDRLLESQVKKRDRQRARKKPMITQTQEMALREIIEVARAKGRYTSLVNHGDARKTVEGLEKKGLVKLLLSPDKTVPTDSRGRRNDPRPLIENVIPTDAGYKYILDQENV